MAELPGINRRNHDLLNDESLLRGVAVAGPAGFRQPGSVALVADWNRVKRRFFDVADNIDAPPGTASLNGDSLDITWPKLGWGSLPTGEWGDVAMVAPDASGQYHAWSIATLSLDGERTGVVVSWKESWRAAPIDPVAGSKCGICVCAHTGQVRTNLLGWRLDESIMPDLDNGDDIDPGEEPESLLPSVRRERDLYPTPLGPGDDGRLLNAVAWRHRADGWGLAGKDFGAHTRQPRTGVLISLDLLFHAPSGRVYDVLTDVAGAATPAWQDKGVEDTLPWVPPVDPQGVSDTPEPVPFIPGGTPGEQLVMSPDPAKLARMSNEQIDAWAQDLLVEHGFDGIDLWLLGQEINASTVRLLSHPDCRIARIIMYTDTDRGGPSRFDDTATRDYLTRILRATRGAGATLLVEPSFDVNEIPDHRQRVAEFVAMAKQVAPGLQGSATWLFGARQHDSPQPLPGDYAAWGDHVTDKAQWPGMCRETLRRAGGKPAAQTDRFRSRSGSTRAKDWTTAQMPDGIRTARRFGVLCSWGFLPDGNHEKGSRPFPNKADIAEANRASTDDDDSREEPPMLMIHGDRYRAWRLRLAHQQWIDDTWDDQNGDGIWTGEKDHVDRQLGREDGPDFLVLTGVQYFAGVAEDEQDEPSAIGRFENGVGNFQLLPRHTVEKDHPDTAFDGTSPVHDITPWVVLPQGSHLRLEGLHSNLDAKPHVEMVVFGFFIRGGDIDKFLVPELDDPNPPKED